MKSERDKIMTIMPYVITVIVLNILSFVNKGSIVVTGTSTVLWLLSLIVLIFKDKFSFNEKTEMIIDTFSVLMFIASIIVITFFDTPTMIIFALLFVYSISNSLT